MSNCLIFVVVVVVFLYFFFVAHIILSHLFNVIYVFILCMYMSLLRVNNHLVDFILIFLELSN